MQLSYRGIHFDHNPTVVDVKEGETIGKYRGSELHAHNPKKRLKLVHYKNLKYRGAGY